MLRGDFINNFSHEFKTPIVSIAGFAKLLKRGDLTEEQRAEYVDIIEAVKANGKYFMYHNHAKEFIKFDGKNVLEHLAEDFTADELGFILDTFWVQAGGADPAAWIEKLSGRLPVIHLKDYAFSDTFKEFNDNIAVVGEGNINFDRVFKAAEGAGVKYMLVEQDNCHGEDPFDCITRSYKYLKSCGF